MHIFRHKFISILFALGQKKLSLKSDQLEVSGSVYVGFERVYKTRFLIPLLNYNHNLIVEFVLNPHTPGIRFWGHSQTTV